eukprot:2489266-Prymnesium_polylepis.1
MGDSCAQSGTWSGVTGDYLDPLALALDKGALPSLRYASAELGEGNRLFREACERRGIEDPY